jgi:hypothetical protein
MGYKNVVSNYAMFGASGADMSVASTTSNITTVTNLDNLGLVCSWSGTSPVGAIAIQASNDSSTWVALDFGSTIAISGNTGSHLINIKNIPYCYVRAVYTKTSGIGTLGLSITAKQD